MPSHIKWTLSPLILWAIATTPSYAHGTQRGLVMLLPTSYSSIVGTLALIATVLLLAILPISRLQKLTTWSRPLYKKNQTELYWPSHLSCLLLMGLILIGYNGNPDPLSNLLPLTIWTHWWVAFLLLQALTGDLWKALNPWRGLLALIRRYTPLKTPPLTYPKQLGYLPAILIFLAFAWLELIDLAPDNPPRLATIVLNYWLFTLAASLIYGEKYWFQYAEPFSILFRLIGHCAPLRHNDTTHKIELTLPGKTLTTLPPLPLSGIFFVLLTLSTVSFDGLSKTFSWLALIDINPLAYPGRSAVMQSNTLGLLAAFITLTILYYTAIALGCHLTKTTNQFKAISERLIYSIIPISLAFHFSHYLTLLITNSQYTLLALNDPLGNGANLLNLSHFHVTTSYLNNLTTVKIIWNTQSIAIILGHIAAVLIAHLTTTQLLPNNKAATLHQLPLTFLMILYTIFGLWLLSTPAIA